MDAKKKKAMITSVNEFMDEQQENEKSGICFAPQQRPRRARWTHVCTHKYREIGLAGFDLVDVLWEHERTLVPGACRTD